MWNSQNKNITIITKQTTTIHVAGLWSDKLRAVSVSENILFSFNWWAEVLGWVCSTERLSVFRSKGPCLLILAFVLDIFGTWLVVEMEKISWNWKNTLKDQILLNEDSYVATSRMHEKYNCDNKKMTMRK